MKRPGKLEVAGSVSRHLYDCVRYGMVDAEREVPQLIADILAQRMWKKRKQDGDGPVVECDTFREFVVGDPPEGLGLTRKHVEQALSDSPGVLDLFTQAWNETDMRTVEGRAKKAFWRAGAGNMVDDHITQATSKTAARLVALKNHDPKLHAQVVAGKLSKQDAFIRAGILKPTANINLAEPAKATALLDQRLGKAKARKLVMAMLDALG